MRAYLSYRFIYVTSGFTSVMFGVTVIAGVLPTEHSRSLPAIAAVLILTAFFFRELVFAVRFHRLPAMNTSVLGDIANVSGQTGTRSLRVPKVRRIGDACFIGLLFVWMSVLASDSPFRLESGPMWPWLIVWWISHVMSVVSNVERTNDAVIFRTTIGTHSIPLHLLKSVTATNGTGYFLHFKFQCGTVNVLNPNYPRVDIQSIKSTLGLQIET